ncbi:MAG TPA: TraI domain-containing protein [Planctomycetota bacterium]|nr:TraI domain-containing protein [Planctomycetota bacterium]
MLPNLAILLGRKDRSDAASKIETFGASRIPRQVGEDLLRATPERRNHIQGIRERLSALTREEKDELVDRVFARVALFVFDLPASESNHHSGRFGLLDHLLEVAHQTVRELSAPAFQVSQEHSTNHREKPLWVYAGMVAAIAHDIGKPLDLDVSAPGSGKCWDPRAEPLRLFCDRHRLPETGPALWHFHVGRGLRGHEKHIGELLPIVLTPAAQEYLGTRLATVVEAMTMNGEWKLVAGKPHPAQEVVRIVRRVDDTTSRKDVTAAKVPSGDPVRPLPSKVPVARPGPVSRQQSLPFPPVPKESPKGQPPPVGRGVVPPCRMAAPADLGDDEEPFLVPPDFRPEPVPELSARRGDPTETALRLRSELDPARFIDTLRRMLLARRLSRNNLCTESYICPDFVWLIVPRALRKVALISRLPWDQATERAMFQSLRASPLVVPASPRLLKVFVRPRPGGASYQAVRIQTRGFLSADEVKCVGTYDYELEALDLLSGSVGET